MTRNRMRRAICFDTTPLIWGVRNDASPGQEHMIERTRRYVQHLTENRYAVMVPSPVVAEYFVGATATQIQEAELLRMGFELPAFTPADAMLAARLQRGGMVEQIHDEFGTPKQSIRIDAFIIAVAINNHADKIVTNNDREFRRLAGGRIEIDVVPELPQQQTMEFAEPTDDPAS